MGIMAHPDARAVAETILRYPACLIMTHISPEGDAIGSMLALALALESRGVAVTCYDRDGVPDNNRFLPTWQRVTRQLPDPLPPLVVYVDADRVERCGVTTDDLRGVQAFARIDHHVYGGDNPGPAWVDTTAAATGELVFALLPLLDAPLTPEIATCLLTALMVDTGRFSHTNTTPTTLRIAATLREAGAELSTIVEWVWGRARASAVRLLGRALANTRISEDGHIAWSLLAARDFADLGATDEDTEGIIDHLRAIRDVEVAALFSEKQAGIRISLRSHGAVDVAAIARQFGGGGHVKAAGITFDGTLAHAETNVLDALRAAIAR